MKDIRTLNEIAAEFGVNETFSENEKDKLFDALIDKFGFNMKSNMNDNRTFSEIAAKFNASIDLCEHIGITNPRSAQQGVTTKKASEIGTDDNVVEKDGYVLDVSKVEKKGGKIVLTLRSIGISGIVTAELNPNDNVYVMDKNEDTFHYKTLNDASRVIETAYAHSLTPGSTEIWYMKPSEFRKFNSSIQGTDLEMLPKIKDLKNTHVLLGKIKETNTTAIYRAMQGDVWSPEGQAVPLLKKLGLMHTSMSVGDVAKINGKYVVCALDGWTTLTESIFTEVDEAFGFISEESIFDVDSSDDWIKKIQGGIKAPHVRVSKSTLGGPQHVAVMITFSLDPKSEWKNGIFENSRYAHLSLENTGELEMFTMSGFGYKKAKALRKTRVKTPEEVVKKINTWIDGVKDIKSDL